MDLLHFSKKVPTLPMQRTMQLKDLVEVRNQQERRVSWCAIFIQAYSLLCARNPTLRQCYSLIPRPHFYEHPTTVASFSIEREVRGENCVFYGKISRSEIKSLCYIDRKIRQLKAIDIEQAPGFQAALRLTRIPRPFRRWLWWYALHDGLVRSHYFGTFGISVVASHGAASLSLLSPLTTTINYGVFQQDGSLDVRINYDHRVMDGAFVARCTVELEQILKEEVRRELLAIAHSVIRVADGSEEAPLVSSV